MPSYVELNKNTSIPASSSNSKLIFGLNSGGHATLTDYLGNTKIIGGGSGPIAIPCSSDFILLQSYNAWFMGGGQAKWTDIANDSGISLTLTLVAAQINGNTISRCDLGQTVTVDFNNLTYRDDGYGTTASNYIDFLNGIFTEFGLYTQFSGNSSTKPSLVSNYCYLDNFVFVFKEVNNFLQYTPCFYCIKSILGTTISDGISDNLIYALKDLNSNGYNYWSDYIPPAS